MVVIGLVVLFAVRRFVPLAIDNFPTYTISLIAVGVVIALICAIWQIIGVSRACKYELQGTAAAGDSVLIYSLIIGYGFILSTSLIDLSRFTLPDSAVPPDFVSSLTTRMVHPYLDSADSILVDGMIEFGLTRQLEKKLQTEKGIRRLVLNSHGGVIGEARGLVRLIREYNLSTHVTSECFSACTLVFISAKKRSIAPEGRLGFHQYLLDSIGFNPGVDPTTQHAIDAELMTSQGVSEAFIDRAYREPHSGLWVPTLKELKQAGVVTNVEP